MADSLRDQLLKAGIKKPAAPRAAKAHQPQPQNKSKSRTGSRSAPPVVGEHDLALAFSQRKRTEQRDKSDRVQKKLRDEKRRRQINRQIREVITNHALNHADAEIPRHFHYKDKIRRILLTAEQLPLLNQGQLAVAYLSGRYYLLSLEQAENIRKISPAHLPDLSAVEDPAEEEHPVPDELVW
jgi:uncharacterized protein YaiL (DUF2058 family)